MWILGHYIEIKRPRCGNFCLELESAEGLRSLKGWDLVRKVQWRGKTKRSSKSKGNESKNKQVGLHQIRKLLHRKENQQNVKANY